MQKFRKQKQSSANSIGTMESRDHSKNGVSPKDLKGVGKIFCICLLFSCIIVQSANAQNATFISTFDFENEFGIEDFYTYRGDPIVYKVEQDANDIYKAKVTILNKELAPGRSFSISIGERAYLSQIKKRWAGYGIFRNSKVYFTQALFNDDAKIEYVIMETDAQGNFEQCKIMSEERYGFRNNSCSLQWNEQRRR